MLGIIILFLVLSIITGSMAFSGIAIISLGIAKVLFFIFLSLFIISLVLRSTQRLP